MGSYPVYEVSSLLFLILAINPARLLFFSTLILGVFITISRSSWFGCWLGLELNLISFIPILSSSQDIYSSEAALKYFLIQALGSAIILIRVCFTFLLNNMANVIILAALLLKRGAAPLHFWFPAVIQGIKMPQCIVLITLQKVAPIVIISYTLSSEAAFIPLIITSITSRIVGAIGGLNQTLIRKIIAYSSINHMAWILAAISISFSLWSFYFLIYSLVTISVILLFQKQQILHIKQVVNVNLKSPMIKIALFINLISLGGLPPFLGFIPKALLINIIALNGQFLWLSFLLFRALITLFFYLRIAIRAFSVLSFKTKRKILPPSNRRLVLTLINFIPLFTPLLVTLPY